PTSSGSFWVMPVMVTVTGSPSGSLMPSTATATSPWFGGHSSAGFATAPLQSGGAFPQSGSSRSVRPSQSSSMPLAQLGLPAGPSVPTVPGVQGCGTPPTQFCTVRRQAPTPQVVVPSPSSASALQSSSIPLQTSALGGPGVQACGMPPTQRGTVRWHAPTPQVVVPRDSTRQVDEQQSPSRRLPSSH